jgi:hypothetical protein
MVRIVDVTGDTLARYHPSRALRAVAEVSQTRLYELHWLGIVLDGDVKLWLACLQADVLSPLSSLYHQSAKAHGPGSCGSIDVTYGN